MPIEKLEELCPGLKGRLTIFSEVSSTNTLVKDMLRKGASRPVVIAGSQTGGKGRAGRSFGSPPGTGLYLTMGLPPLPSGSLPITALVGCCVVRAVESTSQCSATIKWVNDILINEKKVCGVLCETINEGIAIGIGINVHTPAGYFEEAGLPHAGSIASLAGNAPPLEVLAREVIREVDELTSRLSESEYISDQLEFYRTRLVTLGREVSVISPDGSERRGFAADIDSGANLLVDFPTGRESINFGDVSVRGIYGYV